MKFKKNMKKGFTLVELIVVIAIVAILAAVSVVSYIAFINSANESADIQLVKQLNTCLQADEALHGKKDWSEDYQGLRDLLEGNGFIVENLTKTKSGCDMVYQSKTDDETIINRYALLKGENVIYSESTFASGNNHRNFWIPETAEEAQTLTNAGKGVVLGSEIGEVDLFEAHASVIVNGAKVDEIQYSNNGASQKVVICTDGGELTVNDKGTNGSVTHYGALDKALVTTDMNCFVTHGTISYMKLTDGKAIADKNGIIYLMEAETETAAAEERGGVIIIPASATTNEIKTAADKLPEGYVVTETGTTQPANIATKIATNQGLLGSGTENDPFQIYNYQTFQAVSYFFDSGYHYFKVNKELTIKENNNEFRIDCSGWIPVQLNGSFDGNGVKFVNINNKLFKFIGHLPETAEKASILNNWDTKNVVVQNFEANFKMEESLDTAASMTYQVNGNNTTTFNNVTISGRIAGGSNSGAFVAFTGPNIYDKAVDGLSQKIVLNNCKVTANLTCSSGSFGVVSGYPKYCNPNIEIEINNEDSLWQGTGLTESGKIYLYDVWRNYGNISYDCAKLEIKKPAKNSSGYSVEWGNNAERMEVYIAGQLDETDADGKGTAVSGITMSFGHIATIEKGTDKSQNVLGCISSIDFKNKQSEYYASLSDGILSIGVGTKVNYTKGSIKLIVAQYDSSGGMVSCGTFVLAQRSTPTANWEIK